MHVFGTILFVILSINILSLHHMTKIFLYICLQKIVNSSNNEIHFKQFQMKYKLNILLLHV
jgi:hypothetical protein